ncbi:MAG: class I SAM-dependent methyltransferase [Candidatus Hydrogenedentota bacterium]
MKDEELFELWENKIKIELTQEIVNKRFNIWSIFHKWGHNSVVTYLKSINFTKNDTILEVGSGDCYFSSLLDENLSKRYIGLDISNKILSLSKRKVKKIQADLYSLPFRDDSIKVIISIYNLEHLHLLEKGIDEINRVLQMSGSFIFAIPMENGLLYDLARWFTTKRIVEKRYKVDYMKIIREYEHPNTAKNVLKRIKQKFKIVKSGYYPFLVPFINLNLFSVFKAVKYE